MRRRTQTMTKRLFPGFFIVCAAALLAACQPAPLDEIPNPNSQEPAVVPERTTIPYSLKVSTETTRAVYDEIANSYSFNAEDKLQVKGLGDRTDIEGILTKSSEGDNWSGEISYLTSKQAPAANTQLEITLIHAGNADTTTYAKALVGSAPQGKSLLQHAVENYSKFKARVPFGDHAGTLLQQAAFMQFAITFKFDGTHEVGHGGDAKVDLRTSLFEAFADVPFVRVAEGSHDYKVNFIAVIPGGQSLSDFSLTVADREITFQNHNTALTRNTKYTITREITYGPQLGDPFWSDGTYGRMNHPEGSAQIVGIIVYVNHGFSDPDKKAIDDAITEASSGFGHGLVMALHNAAVGVRWSESIGQQHCTDNYVNTPQETIAAGNLSGFKNTNSIINKLGETAVTAASKAKTYTPTVSGNNSGWFLPSIGQWMFTISIDGFGGADHMDQWTNNNGKNWLNEGGKLGDLVRVLVMGNDGNPENLLVKSLNDRLAKLYADFHEDYEFTYDRFGMPDDGNISDNYWTSSEYYEENNTNNQNLKAFRMNLGSVEGHGNHLFSTIKPKPEPKTSTNFPYNGNNYPVKVRPFLAF